ncbi:MAG: hypothetical protein AB9873_14215 [Syntrophobacteraceae bacterium]
MVEKGFVGEYTTHVLESKDTAHIVYFDWINGNLRHAMNGPDGWIIESVDQEGTVGQYIAMARDNIGRLYVSHRDQGKNRLKLSIFDGKQWNSEDVDNEPFASMDTSIFVDALGKIYISYYNFSKGYLKLAVKDKGQWALEIVDRGQKSSDTVGGFSSIEVDSKGRIHISYADNGNGLLKYAVKENDAWTIEVADDSEFVSNFTSLALDEEGNPYISYTVDKSPNKPDLWLAKKVAGKWITELVDTDRIVGNYSSIVVDRDSNIYISYSAMTKLKLATNKEGQWSFEQVDPQGTITYTSLSLDTDGMPHIAYHDKDRGVKYARKVKAA